MLGIIGGHGLFKLDGLESIDARAIVTPFGQPSAAIQVGKIFGQKIAFLPRLGQGDELLATEVNDRANIWALKQVGVRSVVSLAPVVSLGVDLEPGELTQLSQVFDGTRGQRASSFFGSGLAGAIAVNEPVCSSLNEKLTKTAQAHGVKIRPGKTLAAVDGPRFPTLKEREYFEAIGCHLIGMNHVPEIFLAREAGLCYCGLGIVGGGEKIDARSARDFFVRTLESVQFVLKKLILNPVPPAACRCSSAVASAVTANLDLLSGEPKQKLQFLQSP